MFVCSFSILCIYATDEKRADDCTMRGDGNQLFTVIVVAFSIHVFLGVSAILMLALIVHGVYDQETLFAQYTQNCRLDSIIESKTSDLHLTKAVMKQAMAYTANAFVNIFPLIYIIDGTLRLSPTIQIMHLIVRPLQGFLNLLIFLYHKVYNLRRNDPELSIRGAIAAIFVRPGELPEHLLSTLYLVRNHEGDKNDVVELFDYNEIEETDSVANPDTVYGEGNVDKGSDSGNSPSQNTSTSAKKDTTSSSPKPTIEGDNLNTEDERGADLSPGPLNNDPSSGHQSGDYFDDNADISHDPSKGGLSSDSKISYLSRALSVFSDNSMKDSKRKNYYRT